MTTTITGVHTIGVGVTDQEAAIAFYVGTLGFGKRLDAAISPTMRWLEVAPAGSTTSIALVAADPAGSTRGDTGVRFTVPDAAREHAAMQASGVAVGELLRWDGVPPMYEFTDPDGNRFQVVQLEA